MRDMASFPQQQSPVVQRPFVWDPNEGSGSLRPAPPFCPLWLLGSFERHRRGQIPAVQRRGNCVVCRGQHLFPPVQ